MVRRLVGMVWVWVGTWVMYYAYKTSHKYRNSRMHVSIYIPGFTEHQAAGKIKPAPLLPWKSMPPHGKPRRRGTSIPLCVCCLRASSSQEVNYFSLHACLPYGSCRALLVMLGECGSLTPGNTSRTPGGLPGMLLNNEVHSLTSPSKAKFPCCPFQTGTATLTRVTPPTAKKTHHHAFPFDRRGGCFCGAWRISRSITNPSCLVIAIIITWKMTCSVCFAMERLYLPNHLLLLPHVILMAQRWSWCWGESCQFIRIHRVPPPCLARLSLSHRLQCLR